LKDDSDDDDDDVIEKPRTATKLHNSAVDITADELVPLLTPENVANLVLLSMVSFMLSNERRKEQRLCPRNIQEQRPLSPNHPGAASLDPESSRSSVESSSPILYSTTNLDKFLFQSSLLLVSAAITVY